MSIRWTEEQYRQFIGSRSAESGQAASALAAIGVPVVDQPKPKAKRKKASEPALPVAEGRAPQKPKRRGVDVAPIISSVRNCTPKVSYSPGRYPVLAILFDGARLLTVNEIISILQYRKFETFRYKAAWRRLVRKAIEQIPAAEKPFFEGPVRLEIVRRAAKTMDDDSSRMPFKYAIDALVYHPKKKPWGVLRDDNRAVIDSTVTYDVVGPHAVAIRIVALKKAQRGHDKDPIPEWFED